MVKLMRNPVRLETVITAKDEPTQGKGTFFEVGKELKVTDDADRSQAVLIGLLVTRLLVFGVGHA